MRIARMGVVLAIVAMAALAAPALAEEELSDERIEALVQLLQQRGVIEADDADAIIKKNDDYEKQRGWLDRLTFSGDFRGRYEKFWFEDRGNRERLRYRLRFGARAEINDYATVDFALGTGGLSNSTNQTLGSGPDFLSDGVFIDKAFLTLRPLGANASPIPTMTDWKILFGRMSNLFNSKMGKDLILWDGDIKPEGVATTVSFEPCDCFEGNIDAAYYVLSENSSGRAEDMFALQLDTRSKLLDELSLIGAVSYYQLDDLSFGGGPGSGDWEARNVNRGVVSAYYGNTTGVHDTGQVQLVDFREGLEFAGIDDWPVLLYGRYTKNLTARPAAATRTKEDTAWSVGLEVGDKKKFVKLGGGYFYVEADAVPSSLIDSDLFDGHTNGKGGMVYLSRQVWANTDLSLTAFFGDVIEQAIAGPDANRFDRIRLQGDLAVQF